jgi:hypothetical protein
VNDVRIGKITKTLKKKDIKKLPFNFGSKEDGLRKVGRGGIKKPPV